MIHKSTLIKQALRNLTLSKREFAQRADIDYNLFKKILRGKAKIDTDTANKLAHMFGNEPQFWLNNKEA